MSDSRRIQELEKEFRAAVMSELRQIKSSQKGLSKDFDFLDKAVSLSIEKIKNDINIIQHLDESQNKMLDEHIKRSKYLEDLIEIVRAQEITPLRKHVNMVEGGLKLLGLVSVLVGISAGLVKIFTSI